MLRELSHRPPRTASGWKRGCDTDAEDEALLVNLTLTEDATTEYYHKCDVNLVFVAPGCSLIGEKAFDEALIANMTIDYSNSSLRLGEKAFSKVNEEGELTILRICNPGGATPTRPSASAFSSPRSPMTICSRTCSRT